MAGHFHLTTDFARLRRAWRRSACLAGLAAFAVEALGLLAALVAVNALFDLHAVGRTLLIAGAVILLLVHLWRGVLVPLTRRISDRQIALFAEERCPEFEGALLAAAEFADRASDSTAQGRIVLEILQQAQARLQRVDLRNAIRLGRLRKYAALCLLLLVAYALAGVLFPEPIRQTVLTAVNPFYVKPVAEERKTGVVEIPPLTIALTRNDQPLPQELRLTRGGTLRLQALLNRAPLSGKEELTFHFRPRTAPDAPALASGAVPASGMAAQTTSAGAKPALAAGRKSVEQEAVGAVAGDATGSNAGGWQTVPCIAIEQAHAFAVELPDITEDLSFYVSGGAARTQDFVVKTIDPLAVHEIQLTLRYPDYLQSPELCEVRPTADITAVSGTTAILRLRTNNPLRTGTLTWADGTAQELRPEAEDARTALVTVPVEKDGSFTCSLWDVDDQVYEMPVPALVRALPDQPPQIVLKRPVIDVAVHPLGEVTVEAEIKDDWALKEAALIYLRAEAQNSTRVELSLTGELKQVPDAPGASGAGAADGARVARKAALVRHVFRLETLAPKVKPGDLLTYHLEVTDRKGQSASTDVYFVYVTPFETWMSWNPAAPMQQAAGVETVVAPLEKFVAAAWHLKREKARLTPEEYQKRCEELAKKFVQEKDGKKAFINFLEAGQ